MNKVSLLIIFTAIVATASSAMAGQTEADKIASCNAGADMARVIAKDRDAGVPSDEVRAGILKLKGTDPRLKSLVNGMITMIYGDSSLTPLTPDQIGAVTFNNCLDDKGQH
jgi:hypothetical protein